MKLVFETSDISFSGLMGYFVLKNEVVVFIVAEYLNSRW